MHGRTTIWVFVAGKDIGYSTIVDQAGKIYEGRGWNVGGHVLAGQNSISVGVVAAVGNNEPMTDAMREAGAWLYDYIENKANSQNDILVTVTGPTRIVPVLVF